MAPSPADALLLRAANHTGGLTDREVEIVREHIAQAGFNPADQDQVDGRVANLQLGYRLNELRPTQELHCLRHVVAQREWPSGTTQAEYVQSIRDLAVDPRSGVLVSQFRHYGWHAAIVGRSGQRRGPGGFPWCMVEYRVATGHWVTAFQLRDGVAHFGARTRQDGTWLRLPT